MIYQTGAGATDAQLIERMELRTITRELRAWNAAQLPPAFRVGERGVYRSPVDDRVRDAAIAARIISAREEWDRDDRMVSYSGNGVVEVDGVTWWVEGSSVHENRNHDVVAGFVSGQPVFAVEPERLRALSERLADAGELQAAMVFAHYAGDDISGLDSDDASDALNDLTSKMVRVRLWSIDVDEVIPNERHPFLVRVRFETDADIRTDWSVPCFGVPPRWSIDEVPLAGHRRLIGLHLDLPSPDGPLPPD
ncbi:MAG: hypothetical protein KDB21_20245 [Acidimicrobiales bacterium]|nr:hypothetical protein [Acidimicrobiales bacterium]